MAFGLTTPFVRWARECPCLGYGNLQRGKYLPLEDQDSNPSARLALPTVPPCLTFLVMPHHPEYFRCQRGRETVGLKCKLIFIKNLNIIKQSLN